MIILKDFDSSHDAEWQKIMNGLDLDAANSSAEDESSTEDVSPEFCDFLFEKGLFTNDVSIEEGRGLAKF